MSKYKWSQTAANNANADPTVNWAEGQAPSTVNNSSRAEMAASAKERDDLSGVAPSNAILETAGTGTAYTLNSNQVLDALTNGFSLTFRAHTTNTAAATFAVDSLTAKPLRWKTGVELAAGDLIEDYTYTASYYQPTDEWLLRAGGTVPLQADSVTGAQIADNSIDSEHYVDGSIDTIHIADDAVTFDKVQHIATSRLLGRTTAASGPIEELTVGSGLTLAAGALGISTPSGLVFIETQTASASVALAFTSLGTYSSFLFLIDDFRPTSVGEIPRLQIRPTAGSYQTTGYDSVVFAQNTGGNGASTLTTGVGLSFSGGLSVAANYGMHGFLWLKVSGGGRHGVTGQMMYRSQAGLLEFATIAGHHDTAGALDAVRFIMTSGDITSGTIRCYGLV